MDVDVRAPDGASRRILLGQVFACPLLDSNVLEPVETDTVAIRWRVPQTRGRYVLRAGVIDEAGLTAISAPVDVEAR
jgi:hypothetical protein